MSSALSSASRISNEVFIGSRSRRIMYLRQFRGASPNSLSNLRFRRLSIRGTGRNIRAATGHSARTLCVEPKIGHWSFSIGHWPLPERLVFCLIFLPPFFCLKGERGRGGAGRTGLSRPSQAGKWRQRSAMWKLCIFGGESPHRSAGNRWRSGMKEPEW